MKKTQNSIRHCVETLKSPPPPPLPRIWAKKTVTESVTKREISEFWRQKRVDEEDHLLAAIKAAARIRARNLSEEDYKCFMESLENIDGHAEKEDEKNDDDKDEHDKEIRVGIKDWWTKSKYAYLNQPAIGSNNPSNQRASSYVPNRFSFKPSAPLYPTPLGVF